MTYPEVRLGGSLEGGLIITADRPKHLNPNGMLAPQSLVLTPAQSMNLLRQIAELGKP